MWINVYKNTWLGVYIGRQLWYDTQMEALLAVDEDKLIREKDKYEGTFEIPADPAA